MPSPPGGHSENPLGNYLAITMGSCLKKGWVISLAIDSKDGVPSWTSYRAARDSLVKEGKLVPSDSPDTLVFADDVPFSSPSAAAASVLARNSNGRAEWKVEGTAQTYQYWAEEKIQQAGSGEEGKE